MSISNALANALTGLTTVSRQADVVSSNVANAQTEGYGVRTVELSSKTIGRTGAGVEISGINRQFDPVLTSARRFAGAEAALHSTRSDFYNSFSTSMGAVDDASSIAGRITGLESSLIEAASRPESESRLSDVLNEAVKLADQINSAATELSNQRMQAEKEIGDAVSFLQSALQDVVDLNISIRANSSAGYDINSLVDQRQVIIDQISEYVPVKEIQRDGNMVSLYTTGGAILLESKAADLGFTTTPTIVPEMSVAGGTLSTLTINGTEISTDVDRGPISGGKLAALFELRDEIIPENQIKLDAVARDLIERFETTDADPTLGVGAAGLFTDNGDPLDPLDELGLANRISVNALVNPDEGGALWRLRDGLGAATEGDQGNSDILNSLAEALRTPRVAASGGFTNIERSALGLASNLYSLSQTSLLASDTDMAAASAKHETFLSEELAQGVDTDHEMQKLLIIEQNYSANAKVVETVQTLLDQLMGIIR